MKTQVKQRRPEMKISDYLVKEGGKTGSFRKSAVTAKLADGETLTVESLRPSDDQVEVINQFTRSPKTADDLLVFPTMSCNDMYDRDDEGFRRGCISQFKALEPPYSFVGKSFMLDHDYTVSKQVGRIFDEETTKQAIDGVDVEFLKHWVYMPNTPGNLEMATNIDFGIHWAVSVGVVIDSAACTICDSPMYAGRFFSFCYENGHEKGLWYDPDSDEKDAWGWAIPVPDGQDGAVKCFMDMYDPRDGYELSMVFLGAQYFAELAQKDPTFKGLVKTATAGGLPIIGLSKEEAKSLPIPQEDPRVSEARDKYTVIADEDGDLTWVDEAGLKWAWSHDKAELICLGKTIDTDNEEDNDGEEEGQPGDGSTSAGEVVRADGDEVPVGEGDGSDEAGQREVVSEPSPGTEAGGEVLGGGDEGHQPVATAPGTNDEEGEGVDKAAVIAAAKQAGLPEALIEQVQKASGNGLAFLLTRSARLVEIGNKAVADKRADALHWYVVARKEEGDKGVNTETFEKMLDKIGDDLELLDDIITQNKTLAQAKFPKSVRRSSFEKDPHEPDPRPADVKDPDGGEMPEPQQRMVNRIHR